MKFDSISFPIQSSNQRTRCRGRWQRHGDVRRCRRLLSKPATSIEAHEKMNTRDGKTCHRRSPAITLWIRETFPREDKRNVDDVCRCARCDYNHHHIVLLASSVSSGRKCSALFSSFVGVPLLLLLLSRRRQRSLRSSALESNTRLKIAYGFYMFSSFRGPSSSFPSPPPVTRRCLDFWMKAQPLGMEKDLFLLCVVDVAVVFLS